MIHTVSNLFPQPGHPTRGMYNYYLFREMAELMRDAGRPYRNVCLVPEWKLWKWPRIRCWSGAGIHDRMPPTTYLPAAYCPVIGRSVNDYLYSFTLNAWSRAVSPGDTVYAAWMYPDGVAVSRALRGRGARLWLMALGTDVYHHLESRVRRKAILAACEAAEGIVCVSQALAGRLRDEGVPGRKLQVVPNGVDKTRFRYRDRMEAWAELVRVARPDDRLAPADGKTGFILFVGNLVPVKGPVCLLRAVRLLSPARPVVIIGDGPLRPDLERYTRQQGLAGQIHFMGRRRPDEVALWMNAAELLCLPSVSEGMPNVVLEARASGLPVVASPAGAVPELPLDRNHLVVAGSASEGDMAAALSELLSRDRSDRRADPAVPAWADQARKIVSLMG